MIFGVENMNNKTASLILNSAKSLGLSDVFVAQPDSLKESAAGKIFLLAEISAKKNEGNKLFSFIIQSLEEDYYESDEVLFHSHNGKVAVGKVFEEAVSSLNKKLNSFLQAERLRLNPGIDNLTVGVIHENRLFFSSIGNNRAFLVYPRNGNYEIMNIEAQAAEEEPEESESDEDGVKLIMPKAFSSVVSGEIPTAAYFIFSNEALPEYISNKDLIDIITKLPPIAASEQIKNILSGINNFIPFLGIIIKNTASQAGQEREEELPAAKAASSAHRSISSLNYTEQKTEQMLAPAGLINFSKISAATKVFLEKIKPEDKKKGREKKRWQNIDNEETPLSAPLPEINQIKSLNQAHADSFFIKDKIVFKKKANYFSGLGKKMAVSLTNAIDPQLWIGFFSDSRSWVKKLNPKNRVLFISLGVIVAIFVISLSYTNWHQKRLAEEQAFSDLATSIENQTASINTHLLYGDENGALEAYNQAFAGLSSLPQDRQYQKDSYSRLAAALEESRQKVQKISQAAPLKLFEIPDPEASSLIFLDKQLYAAGKNSIYSAAPVASSSVSQKAASGFKQLVNPVADAESSKLYYKDGASVYELDVKKGASRTLTIADGGKPSDIYRLYNNYFYLLDPPNNQIFRYRISNGQIASQVAWLQDNSDISQTGDLAIDAADGRLYILNHDGSVNKYFKGQKTDFQSAPLSPAISQASRLEIDNNYLYIFSATDKRLALVNKSSGKLARQYDFSGLANLKGAAVDSASQKAYLLDGQSVYEIDISK